MERIRRIAIPLIGLWLLLLLSISVAWAKPTTSEQARQVVANWIVLERQPLGARMSQQVKDIQTFADASGPLYFVVYLEPAGLVLVPGDDLVEPIIGFAREAKVYDPSDANPLGSLANRDIPGRVLQARQLEQQAEIKGRVFAPSVVQQKAQGKWTALQQGQSPQDMLGEGLDSLTILEDTWVAPVVQSKWSQNLVNDNNPGSAHCYDYYTNWGGIYYPCGCMATAMAQVMRKWQYPASPNVGTFPITVGGSAQSATIRGGDGAGGNYNWGLMELDPKTNGASVPQCQAIGDLTFDAGVAVSSDYLTNGTSANLLAPPQVFKNTFKYSNANCGFSGAANLPSNILFNMTNANLDAGYPVIFRIANAGGGHFVVGDGYGTNWSTWYHHLNMGWAGASDLWYNLPDVNSGAPGPFTTLNGCIYNIYTTGTGEIISGRVTTSCGAPVAGVTVTASGPGNPPAATTSASGIYAFPKLAANATYTIHAVGTGYTDQVVTTGQSVDNNLTCGNQWGVNFVANRSPVTNPEYVLYNLGASNNTSGTLELKASNAYGINNLGQIAGGMKTDNSKLNNNPCIWVETQKGKFTFVRWGADVVDYGELLGINDSGSLAAGYAYKSTWPSGTQELPIYVQNNGTTMNLNYLTVPSTSAPFGRAYGVNNNGQIVGNTSMGTNDISCCLWPTLSATAQRIDNLGGFGGTSQTYASRINNAGWITGMNYNKAFLWNGSSVSWLGPSGGNGLGCGLNNLNPPTVVGLTGTSGYVGTRAVIFNGTAVTELSSTDSAANGVNGQGKIVGQAQFGGRSHAFIYDQTTGSRDLNTLVNEPDWELVSSNDINSNGEIVGWGWYGAGHCYNVPMAFMLRPLFTITASAGAGGAISPTGAVKVVRGDNLTFTIIPNAGFQIANVVVDGASQGAIGSYTFTNVTANHTISATFTGGATHTITASAGSGGSISPSGAVSVNHGANQTFNITPLAGFRIAAVMVDGVSQGAISSYTFNNVTADHTISASFVVLTYTITASAGNGGSISPSGSVQVNYGANQTFNITANSGYQIADVVVDGTSKGAISSYTFNSVTANHTIAASFTAVSTTYTISGSAGSGGSISPSGTVTINSGGSQTFTITANSGYQIADVKVDNVSQGAISSYTFTNVQANHTIAASFSAVTTTYTITASAGVGGSISPSGTVTVNAGASRTFTITANTGYKVAEVKVDNVSQGAITSYTFTNVQANHTIAASFSAVTGTFTISASAGSGGSISPSGTVTVNAGASQTFTMTQNTGYAINDVLVDGASVGGRTSYTFTNVTANHTISASFKKPGSCGAFFDHFDGSQLGSTWTVRNPDTANYSLSNSFLHTITLPGDLGATTPYYHNLLLIQNPAGNCDFQITMKVSGWQPMNGAAQEISLIAYVDAHNFVRCSNTISSNQRCWKLTRQQGADFYNTFDYSTATDPAFYLRLVKTGNTYRQYSSVDGSTYVKRNQDMTFNSGTPPYLGFIAIQDGYTTIAPVSVDIDFFAVDSLNTPGKKAVAGNLELLLLSD